MAESAKSPTPSVSSEAINISTEETDTDSSTDDMQPPAPKKMKRPKKFVDSWLKDPFFTPWLAKSEGNPYEAKCLLCNTTISAGRSHLIRHSSEKTHLEHMAVAGMEAGETASKSDDNDSGINIHLVKKAELRHVLYIVLHSRSLNSYEHYVPMVHAAHADCNCISLKKMQLKRSKIEAIIKNVLSKTIVQRTIRILKRKMFTILIDESTVVTGTKALCVLVRYVHEGNIQTYLLDYVKVKDASAESLYKYLKYLLQKYKLSIKNIIGISTDNASVMLGKKKSVVALLSKENSNVAVFPCICHNMHLLASDACKCLPRNLKKLLYKLCTYLSRSPKKQGELAKIQIEMHLAKHRMIHPSRTRWLALYECVHRILEQWAALIKFFEIEVTSKSDSEMESSMSQSQSESGLSDTSDVVQSKKSSLQIVSALRCLYTKAYLQFIDFTLSTITKFNKIFQTTDLLVHNLLEYCHNFLKEIGRNFINYEVIAGAPNLHEIDPFKSENLLPLEAMFIGEKAKSTLDEIQATDTYEQEKITTFLQNCQKFYQTTYKGAIKRLPFNNNFIKALEFLKPSVAIDIKKHTGQVKDILNKFESKFDRAACLDEWYALGFLTVREDDMRERLLRLEIVQFWDEINKMCYPGGDKLFKNISNLALACLSLSHSNAEIERFFSLVSEIKTPDRNRLQPQMVAALGRIKLEFRNSGMQCSNYIISDDFVQNFNSGMYKKERIPQEFANVIESDSEFTSESDDSN